MARLSLHLWSTAVAWRTANANRPPGQSGQAWRMAQPCRSLGQAPVASRNEISCVTGAKPWGGGVVF